MSSPRYEHHCESCTFLGQFGSDDLYYCPQGDKPTVIARYGDEGHEYLSGLHSALPELVEARKRAAERGLVQH